MSFSPTQQRCIIEATIEPLVSFRRGFARTKEGPFFALCTVNSLVRVGALRPIRDRAGRHYLRLSARSE